MAGHDQRSLGRTVGFALGLAVLLGVAAAGGSLIRGTSTEATAADAFPYAAIGALALAAAAGIVLVTIRLVRPGALTLRMSEVLAILFVAAALGALIGAALTPTTPDAEDVSPLDEDEIDRRNEQTGSFGEDTRAGTVDRDGDGVPDRDADGNVIIGYDLDGDGRLDGYLQECPPGTGRAPSRPGYTPIDNDCDGTIDEWLPFDPDQFLATDQDFQPRPIDTISPEERQQRADSQGADGQRRSTLRNVLIVLAALAVGALLIVLIVRMPDRKGDDEADDPPGPPEPPAPVDVAQPLVASLGAIREHPDPRTAICAAYGRLLDGFAEIGLPRRPEEAPVEHIARCLGASPMDPRAVAELLDLFALARFSTHPITEQHRAAAERAMRSALAPVVGGV